MLRTNSPGSPLETASGTVEPGTTAAFGLLGNETRLAILLALWEAYDPCASDNVVSFSELRERVGMRDSGQFNYHLDKLTEHFVKATDDGYQFQPVGLKLVQTLIAGTGGTVHFERTALDLSCPYCRSRTEIDYQDGWLYLLCSGCDGGFGVNEDYPDGILFGEPFPAAALLNRTPEEVFAAGVFQLHQVMAMKMGGLCPRCSGVVESTVEVCADHDSSLGDVCSSCGNAAQGRIRWVCSVCKYMGSSSPSGAMIVHPEVVAFYHDHGVDVGSTSDDFATSKRLLELVWNHEQELLSTDPLRFLVTVRYDGDELQLTLDDELTAVEIYRSD